MSYSTLDREGLEQTAASGTYASFLIRLWCESGGQRPEPCAAWRAEVEHIQSGKLSTFDDVENALKFVRQQTAGQQLSDGERVMPSAAG